MKPSDHDLTFAPEAGTDRLRSVIGKQMGEDELFAAAEAAFSSGWSRLKLYFMIGHPSETLEDVQAIADLCKRVIAEGRKVIGMKAKLNAGVSTFVPKSQTPFQWVSCDTPEQIRAIVMPRLPRAGRMLMSDVNSMHSSRPRPG